MPTVQWNESLVTSNDTPTQIGDDIPLPTNSITTVDIEVREIMTDGSLSKRFNIRREFHNEGDVVTADDPIEMVPTAQPKGALDGSVEIDDDGTDAKVMVAGPASDDVKWDVDCQYTSVAAQAAVDPATLSLTIFWKKGDYTSSAGNGTWDGAASAGSSGSRDATNASTAPPATSGAPDFEDSNSHYLSNATAWDTLFSASGGTIIVITRADAAPSPAGSLYANPQIVADNANGAHGLCFNSSGVKAFGYDGAEKSPAYIAQSTGSFFMATMRWNGSQLKLQIDDDAAGQQTTSCGNMTVLSSATQLSLGISYSSAAFYDGETRLVICAASHLSDETIAGIYQWAVEEGLFS